MGEIRDLDEMRAFKNSERRLLQEIEKSVLPLGRTTFEGRLQDLRTAHTRYIRGEMVLQPVEQLFDYADWNFDSPRKGDS